MVVNDMSKQALESSTPQLRYPATPQTWSWRLRRPCVNSLYSRCSTPSLCSACKETLRIRSALCVIPIIPEIYSRTSLLSACTLWIPAAGERRQTFQLIKLS